MLKNMLEGKIGTATQCSAEDFTCSQCQVTRRVNLVSTALAANNIVLELGQGVKKAAQKQADRHLAEMRRMLVCPNCGHKNGGAYAWFFTKAATVGLVIGLIGAVPGLFLWIAFRWPIWASLAAGILAVAIPASVIIYCRRLKDMRLGIRFEP